LLSRRDTLKIISLTVGYAVIPKSVNAAVRFIFQDNITIQNPYNGYLLQLPAGINDTNKDDIRSIDDILIVESDQPIVVDPPVGNSSNFTIDTYVEPQGNNLYHVHLKMQTGADASTEDVVLNVKYDPSVGVENEKKLPSDYKLSQNFPNPFNPSTTISYELKSSADVEIIVRDVLGQKVKEISQGYQSPGKYNLPFNANNLSSGTYLYSLIVDGKPIETKEMMVVK